MIDENTKKSDGSVSARVVIGNSGESLDYQSTSVTLIQEAEFWRGFSEHIASRPQVRHWIITITASKDVKLNIPYDLINDASQVKLILLTYENKLEAYRPISGSVIFTSLPNEGTALGKLEYTFEFIAKSDDDTPAVISEGIGSIEN